MNSLPSALDLGLLERELEALGFWRDASGIEMSHLQGEGFPKWIADRPALQRAVSEIRALTGRKPVGLMVNRLGPGVTVPKHTDADTGHARWHLPITTNPDATWWDEQDGEVHMSAGAWWGPVPYALPHQVANRGPAPRIHIIVDTEGEA